MSRGDVNRILEQARTDREAREREGLKGRFLEIFPDGFKTLPKGFQFRSKDPRGFLISVFPSPSKTTLYIYLEAEERDSRRGTKKVYNKYQVSREGEIRTTDPPEFGPVSEVALLTEVLDGAQEIALLNWRTTSLELDPRGEEEEGRVADGPSERSKDGGADGIDMTRVQLLVGRSEVLAQFIDERRGFKGYRMWLLPRGVILESDRVRNAAYVVRFKGRIGKTRRELRTMPDEELDQMIRSMPEAELIAAPKSVKRAEAARPGSPVRRIVHVGSWTARLEEAIKEIS